MTFYYEEKKPVLHDVFMEFKKELRVEAHVVLHNGHVQLPAGNGLLGLLAGQGLHQMCIRDSRSIASITSSRVMTLVTLAGSRVWCSFLA